MLLRLVGSIVVLAALAGCETGKVVTTNTMANPGASANAEIDTFQLSSIDLDFAAKKAIDEFMQSPQWGRRGERRWVVAMGDVSNRTANRFSTRDVTAKIKSYMQRSGNFIFTAAVGADTNSMIRDYRELERSRMFDKQSGSQSLAVKPDLAMDGQIRQRSVVSADRRQQSQQYVFDLRVVELGTGLELFQAVIPIDKTGSNSRSPW
jgi:PBP1b-binding outer membrane lipoprotein LpoB